MAAVGVVLIAPCSDNYQFKRWPPHNDRMCDHQPNYSNIDPTCYFPGNTGTPSLANSMLALSKQGKSFVVFVN